MGSYYNSLVYLNVILYISKHNRSYDEYKQPSKKFDGCFSLFFYNSSLYYKKILDFKIKNRYSVPIELVYNSIGTL